MEALRPDICSGHRMVLGLDTIICNSIESILQWNGDCGLLDDPLNPGELCNGVGIYSQSCAGRLWHLWQNRDRLFTKEELYYVPDYEIGKISHKQGYLSEMAFLRTVMHQQAARLNRIFPNQIQSYKVHWKESGRQMKNQASIIYFHGNPKPPKVEQELLEHWV